MELRFDEEIEREYVPKNVMITGGAGFM